MSDEIMSTDDLQDAAVSSDVVKFKQLLEDFGASVPDEVPGNSKQSVTGLEYIQSAIRLGGETIVSKDEVGTKTEKLTKKMTVIYKDQKKAAIEEFIANNGVAPNDAETKAPASQDIATLQQQVNDLKDLVKTQKEALESQERRFDTLAWLFREFADPKQGKAAIAIGTLDKELRDLKQNLRTPAMPNL